MPRTEKFIELDRTQGPTPAASDFNKRLIQAGHAHYNLGQGSEKTPLTREAKKLAYGNLLQTLAPSLGTALRSIFLRNKLEDEAFAKLDGEMDYNANGDPKLESAVSAWSKRIFGFGGHPRTTCTSQQLERGIMGDVVNKWGAIYRDKYKERDPKPVALVPANSWALTNNTLEEAGFEVVEFQIDPDDMAGSYERALEAQVNRVVGISYFNFPHNATGLHLTREDNLRIKEIADNYNQSAAYKMMLLYDMPYFSACEKNENPELQGYLDTGLEGVFDDKDFDPVDSGPVTTPVAVCCSGSKFFRMAKRGFSWGLFTRDIIKDVRARLNLSGNGVRRDPEFNETMNAALQEEHDHIWKEQLDADRRKFGDNYRYLCDKFDKAVIKGGPNLVALIRLPDVFNKVVKCHDGVVRNIHGPGKGGRQDAIEIIANGTEHEAGVLLVDGDETMQGESLFRIALAMPAEEFRQAVDRLHRIYTYIGQSDKYTPSV